MRAGSTLSTAGAVLLLPLVLVLTMAGPSRAQENITIYSTVIFSRMGERTPVLTMPGEITHLTSYGAQQMYDMGAWYRTRYLTQTEYGATVLFGLNPDTYQVNPMNLLASYQPEAAASALAFMQSFYPPIPLSEEADASDVLWNGDLMPYPGGMQYPLVETFTPNDPYSMFISGSDNCLTGDIARDNWLVSNEGQTIWNETLGMYQYIGMNFLSSRLNLSEMNFGNAWQMYDAIDYLNRHNAWTNEQFSAGNQFGGALPWMADLASKQTWEFFGNYSGKTTAQNNPITSAGSTLAGAVYMYFTQMLNSGGVEQVFNLIIADFEPIISMLALMGMGNVAEDYKMLPPYATSIAFELFTYDDPSSVYELPDPSKMFVRFYFRNGTAPGDTASSWALPMFGNGPSQTDMTWENFSQAIQNIAFLYEINWCDACEAAAVVAWCQGLDSWAGEAGASGAYAPPAKKGVTVVQAGVIGAFVTLAITGIVAGILAVLFGWRVQKRGNSPASRLSAPSWLGGAFAWLPWVRRRRDASSSIGGYKGSSKMASDADLHIPPNAAPMGIGAFVVSDDKDPKAFVKDIETGSIQTQKSHRAHERVGSWELKNTDDLNASGHQRFASVGSTIVGGGALATGEGEDHFRPSFEGDEDEDAHEVFSPVRPRESF